MNAGWKFKLLLVLFLLIPVYGICQFGKHLAIINSEVSLSIPELVPELEKSAKGELRQVRLSGFDVDDVEVKTVGQYEYSFVMDPDECCIVVLHRMKSTKGSLIDEILKGSIVGLTSRGASISREHVEEMGLSLPDFAPESFQRVDVDRQYLSSIALLTAGFMIIGLVWLGFLYLKYDDEKFEGECRRNYTEAQVALHISIANQGVIRNQFSSDTQCEMLGGNESRVKLSFPQQPARATSDVTREESQPTRATTTTGS